MQDERLKGSPLGALFCAIASRDRVAALRMLTESPDCALAVVETGDVFFDEIAHYAYVEMPGATRCLRSPVAAARTWLASVGWRVRGLIRMDERPRGAP